MIESKEARISVIAEIVPFLPKSLKVNILREILTPNRLQEILTATQMFTSNGTFIRINEVSEVYTEMLVKLFPHLPKSLLQELVVQTQTIKDPENRFKVLMELIPYLPNLLRKKTLQQVLVITQSSLETQTLTMMLVKLVPWADELPSKTFLLLWQKLIKNLAYRSRKDLLRGLRDLNPVIIKLGGQEAIVELFYAIQDVRHWWP